MPEPESRVLTDDAIAPAVLSLIREAEEYVDLVSPFNSFWEHLKNEIGRAVQRGVRVTAIFRKDQLDSKSRKGPKSREDAEWLCGEGVTVYAVPYLHAKLYLNESSVLLTSMNLLQLSSRNSMEVGIRVDDEEDARALRLYAKKCTELGSLVDAERLSSAPPQSAPRPEDRRPREAREGNSVYRIGKKILGVMTQGRCLRCNAYIPYKVESPLCDKCFAEWSRFENPHYRERYCHGCGCEWETTYAKPLCTSCQQKHGRPRSPFG